MSDFDPGTGWREVQYGQELEGHEHIMWNSTGRSGGTQRMWVREQPLQPLPTEADTLIGVTYLDPPSKAKWVLNDSGMWREVGRPGCMTAAQLAVYITSFEVLAGPLMKDEITWEETAERVRRETAKAVLDRVRRVMSRAHVPDDVWPQVEAVSRECGVTE